MSDSLSDRPQLRVAPRSGTRFAVRRDIRTNQVIGERNIALLGWQDAPGTLLIGNLIPLGISLRMTMDITLVGFLDGGPYHYRHLTYRATTGGLSEIAFHEKTGGSQEVFFRWTRIFPFPSRHCRPLHPHSMMSDSSLGAG